MSFDDDLDFNFKATQDSGNTATDDVSQLFENNDEEESDLEVKSSQVKFQKFITDYFNKFIKEKNISSS